MSAQTRIQVFLDDHKSPKGGIFTHTSLKGGSYYIPTDDYYTFMSYYESAITANIPQYFTEKHSFV